MYRIMIIDDETTSQNMLSNFIKLKLPMYEIKHICGNGQEALTAFRACPVDILLVDIRMPIMDGLTFIEKLNEITTDVVPIIISSYSEFSYAKTAMRLGVAHYLLKPIDFKELTHALNAASQTLKFKRVTYTPHSLMDDYKEIYIHDLLTGQYADAELARQKFAQLSFPFSYDTCNGLYLNIEFVNTEAWMYGRDSLITAISNLMNLIYTPVFLLPTFHRHRSCDYLFICDRHIPKEFEELLRQSYQLLNISITADIRFAFSSMEQLNVSSNSSSAQKSLLTSSQMSPAIANLDTIDYLTTDMENSILQTAIKNAVSYMQEHYAEDLTRDIVAEKVYMSGAYFSRCFKLIAGISYKDYLTELRMQKAIQLLKSNAKISDIAQQVGYSSPNRFNINFRQYTSYTPSEYRTHVLKIL